MLNIGRSALPAGIALPLAAVIAVLAITQAVTLAEAHQSTAACQPKEYGGANRALRATATAAMATIGPTMSTDATGKQTGGVSGPGPT